MKYKKHEVVSAILYGYIGLPVKHIKFGKGQIHAFRVLFEAEFESGHKCLCKEEDLELLPLSNEMKKMLYNKEKSEPTWKIE